MNFPTSCGWLFQPVVEQLYQSRFISNHVRFPESLLYNYIRSIWGWLLRVICQTYLAIFPMNVRFPESYTAPYFSGWLEVLLPSWFGFGDPGFLSQSSNQWFIIQLHLIKLHFNFNELKLASVFFKCTSKLNISRLTWVGKVLKTLDTYIRSVSP